MGGPYGLFQYQYSGQQTQIRRNNFCFHDYVHTFDFIESDLKKKFTEFSEFQIVPSGSSSTIIESKGFLKISGKYRQFAINVIGLDGTKTAELFS